MTTGGRRVSRSSRKSRSAILLALIEDVGADKAKFLAYLKVQSLADIPAAQFSRAVDASMPSGGEDGRSFRARMHGGKSERQVTASRVADVIAKTKTGYSASRANYMARA